MPTVKKVGATVNFRILKRIAWCYSDTCLFDGSVEERNAFDPRFRIEMADLDRWVASTVQRGRTRGGVP